MKNNEREPLRRKNNNELAHNPMLDTMSVPVSAAGNTIFMLFFIKRRVIVLPVKMESVEMMWVVIWEDIKLSRNEFFIEMDMKEAIMVPRTEFIKNHPMIDFIKSTSNIDNRPLSMI